MRKIKSMLLVALAAISLAACDNDGDTLYAGVGEGTLSGATDDIVLDADKINDLALTVYWTDNGTLTLSDPKVAAADNAITNTVQLSATEDFSTVEDVVADAGNFYYQFTHSTLNAALSHLAYPEGQSSPLYIRVKMSLGDNVEPSYTNVLKVNVTPYTIDMSVGYILDANKGETEMTLSSVNSDGIYSGFIGAAAWYNYWLKEGDGTIWGNDGVSGTPFAASTASTSWNFWYPGLTGCYYTIVDTNNSEWSALYISSLSVSGDITGEMTSDNGYDRKSNKWTLTFNAESAGAKTIRIAGEGFQYNVSTGTDDASAVSTAVGFGGSADNLTFGSSASDITVNVPTAGEVTLTIDLSNPTQWTVSVESGGAVVVETPQYVYLSGADDGISGGWTFDRFLTLCNEDELRYAGVVNVNSLWGYLVYTEKDNWSSNYGMADGGTAESGSLVQSGSNNITAPTPGLYIIDVNMSALTYATTAINKVAFTGFNDDWNLYEMTADASTVGLYTADVELTAETPWGFQIIINDDWNIKFGGSDGKLVYVGGNIPASDYELGSYTLTVDLCAGTYSLTKK